ncbi:RlpA-like protein precursor [Hartmannibacter diazotrophicus]|uniref:Endolytic peptidoglycan transglycosylase RlpA n=1 Tax=Hartmannibacter diazotrophicus TaxID=1482074 RepID=A0A2C9D6V4_9HYPH|nr:septal ring lytic transglycosylase RlpA family protein [Hartmannibacter diazotrophicus]SON55920.1 RlpA-like protein precursor [Hartmannibacter diazotrophicus]
MKKQNGFGETANNARFANWRTARLAATALLTTLALAACSSGPDQILTRTSAKLDPKLGVKPSPRVVADGNPIPKGGGRSMVGKPYVVAGKRYVPRLNPDYAAVGLASWYGSAFQGRYTANGEIYDMNHLSAAHTTMPLPSYARVTSLDTGRSVIVRVNDRGPFHGKRIMDLSKRAADMLGVRQAGVAKIKVAYVGPAPTEGDDTRYLMASYRGPDGVVPGGTMPGTTLASNDKALPGVDVPTASRKSAPAPLTQVARLNVLPPERPMDGVEVYAIVASNADPVDAFLTSSGTMVASADIVTPQAQVTNASYTVPTQGPAFVQKVSYAPSAEPAVSDAGNPFGTFVPTPREMPSMRNSYAEDRINQAYSAVTDVGQGLSLSQLQARLKTEATTTSPVAVSAGGNASSPVIELGSFSDAANADRLTAALSHLGDVAVDDFVANGRTLKRVRLTALADGVTTDAAIKAASEAGAGGAFVRR